MLFLYEVEIKFYFKMYQIFNCKSVLTKNELRLGLRKMKIIQRILVFCLILLGKELHFQEV